MCACAGSPMVGLTFAILLMFFCLIWWLSYRFDNLSEEIKKIKG